MQVSTKGGQFIDKITGEPLELAGSHTWSLAPDRAFINDP